MVGWFELRVEGSAGTRAGITAGARDGIAIGDDGRLCSLTSGGAKRFESAQDAVDYLDRLKLSGDYRFEAIHCRAQAAA